MLIAGVLTVSWLGMQTVHEAGHVLGAWATGGTVVDVELTPWSLSRTDVRPNPAPLVVAWGGAIVGVLLPLLAWLVAERRYHGFAYLFRFFAGLCLIANGAYIGAGAWRPVGDAADILRLQPHVFPLVLFGLAAVGSGLKLWHGMGARFGLGVEGRPVCRRDAVACVLLAILLVAVEVVIAFTRRL